MNKIAICLFGLSGGSAGKDGKGKNLDLKFSREGYIKAFENKYKVDYYIHTWSIDIEKEINHAFKPIKMISEPKIEFNKFFWIKKILKRITYKQLIKFFFGKFNLNNEAHHAYRAYSRWISTQKSFKLIPSERLSDYSFILSSRLDVEFFSEFFLEEDLTNETLVVSNYNNAPIESIRDTADKKNLTEELKAFLDLWFAGRPKVMAKFTSLIDRFDNYDYNPHVSSYNHAKHLKLKPLFKFFRFFDYELVRRYRFKSNL